MSNAILRIEIDSREIDLVLGTLFQKLNNPRPLLLEIGNEMEESTKRRFETSTAPDGTTWEKNSDVTLARKSGTKPLIDGGDLFGDIHYSLFGNDEVLIGSNKKYAAMMQFGGTTEQFPHLWGDIPARPFLGFSDADDQVILDLVEDYLL